MTITQPAPTTTRLRPRHFRALRRWVDASLAAIRRTRHAPRHPARTPAFSPPLTVWQLDRHELDSALEHRHW